MNELIEGLIRDLRGHTESELTWPDGLFATRKDNSVAFHIYSIDSKLFFVGNLFVDLSRWLKNQPGECKIITRLDLFEMFAL